MLESQSPQAGGCGAGSARHPDGEEEGEQRRRRERQKEGCPDDVMLQGNALGVVAFLCHWAEGDTVPSGHLDF